MRLSYVRNTLFLSIFFIFSNCNVVKDIEIVDPGDLSLVSFNNETLELDIKSKIYNPNFFDIQINKIEFNISHEDVKLGEGLIENPIKIKRKDTLEINSDLIFFLKNINSEMIFQKKIKIDIDGVAYVSKPINKFYFSQFQSLDLSKYIDDLVNKSFSPEDIRINNLKVSSISLNNFTIDGVFNLNNSNNFDYSIDNIVVDFFSDSRYQNKISSTRLNKNFIVFSDSINDFEFSLPLNTLDFGELFVSSLFGGKKILYLKINSDVKINEFSFPVSIEEKLTF